MTCPGPFPGTPSSQSQACHDQKKSHQRTEFTGWRHGRWRRWRWRRRRQCLILRQPGVQLIEIGDHRPLAALALAPDRQAPFQLPASGRFLRDPQMGSNGFPAEQPDSSVRFHRDAPPPGGKCGLYTPDFLYFPMFSVSLSRTARYLARQWWALWKMGTWHEGGWVNRCADSAGVQGLDADFAQSTSQGPGRRRRWGPPPPAPALAPSNLASGSPQPRICRRRRQASSISASFLA